MDYEATIAEIAQSAFPLSTEYITHGLRIAHGKRIYVEDDPCNELLNRLSDEGFVDFLQLKTGRFQWDITDFGQGMLNHLNSDHLRARTPHL